MEIQACLANFYLVFARSTFAPTPGNVLGEGARLDEPSAKCLRCQVPGWVGVHQGLSHLGLSPSTLDPASLSSGESRGTLTKI